MRQALLTLLQSVVLALESISQSLTVNMALAAV